MGFLNPLLLWTLPLCAVPIIIHLLNRRRFQTIRWAAMEYLLNALKRNKRRIQMEHWILLALRTLAIALLIFLVARPQMSGSLLTGVKTHHVLVLDDTCSLQQRAAATTVWKQALEALRIEAERLARTREGDLVSVLRLSRPGKPDLAGVRVSAQLPARIREFSESLEIGEGAFDLGPALEAAHQRMAETKEASKAVIRVLTDFRRHDWLTKDGKPRAEIEKQLAALDPAKHELLIAALAGKDQENLAITGLTKLDRVAVVGQPITLAVEVQNKGLLASAVTEMTLEFDGTTRINQSVEPLEPGQGTTVHVQYTFRSPGFHGVLASLPPDHYPPDDKRGFALEIKERSKAMLVDGDPGQTEDENETHYLAAALEPGGDVISAVQPLVVPEHAFADQDLSEIDVIWLCNLAAPGEALVKKLEDFVRGGGGLAIFVGNQVDSGRYDQVLHKDGTGLLPLRLAETAGDFDNPEAGFVADKAHGVVAAVADAMEFLLARQVQVGRYLTVVEDGRAAVGVPLRVRDGRGPPLLITKSFGEQGGRVALCTTTADLAWTNLGKTFVLVPLANEMQRYLARLQTTAAYNLGTSGAVTLMLDPALYRADVVVRDLGGPGAERTFTGLAREGGALQVEIPMPELRGFGLFEIGITPHTGQKEVRQLSRSSPADEGAMATMSMAALQSSYPPELAAKVKLVAGEGEIMQQAQGELWKTLAWLLLAFLLLETVLAWRFGRRAP